MDLGPILSVAAASAPQVDIARAVGDSDFVGWMCLLGCLVLSLGSWAVIFYKLHAVRRASVESDRFDQVLDSAGSLEEVFRRTREFPHSPIAMICREAFLEMEAENWYSDPMYDLEERLTAARLGVERVMERTIANEVRDLESHLILLATTTNVAPLVGLFGTVWGVLAAFQALSQSGSVAVSALGPGISTALVTTVAGLVAAIPASVFYNFLGSRIGDLTVRMDSFALELANIIQKRMVKQIALEREARGV